MPKSMQFAKGSIVYFEGDRGESIYILQQGTIVLKSADLETGALIQEQLHTGEFFGVKSALAHMPRIETASVLEDSTVVELSVAEFEKIFGTKRVVTEKMLRVFSKSLRDIHKQTEAILKKDVQERPAGEGMFMVANAFYDDEEYRSAVNILDRIIQKYSASVDKAQLEKLYADAKLNADRMEHDQKSSRFAVNDTGSEDGGLKQFSLPVFDKFTKNYKKGDVIISEFEPGETFYLIKKGRVQIVKCMNGKNKNLDVLKPGEFFGEMAILDNSPRTATCVARGDVACLEFDKANFSSLVLGNGQIVMQLLKLFCKRICDQRRRFKIILIKEMNVRICDIFLMYDELVNGGRRNEDNQKRRFDISVSDVASWAGIGVNQARDELNKFVDRHRLEIFDGYMVVTNIHDCKRTVDSYYKKLNLSDQRSDDMKSSSDN